MFFPVSIMLQMILPFPYGIGAALLLGPGFIIAGVIFVIKDKKTISSTNNSEKKFCTKCGQQLPSQVSYCTKCGTKSEVRK